MLWYLEEVVVAVQYVLICVGSECGGWSPFMQAFTFLDANIKVAQLHCMCKANLKDDSRNSSLLRHRYTQPSTVDKQESVGSLGPWDGRRSAMLSYLVYGCASMTLDMEKSK